ncbi:MAG: polysaccharide biosynthesis protein [Betaproteobacteria bacterium]
MNAVLLRAKRVGLPLLDGLLVAGTVGLAYAVRFDGRIPPLYRDGLPRLVALWVLVRITWLVVYRFYSQRWEYASIRELLVTATAVTVGSLTLFSANFFLPFNGFLVRVPRSIFVIEWFLTTFVLGGSRLLVRIAHEANKQQANSGRENCSTHAGTPHKRLLIIGAGDAGAMALREIQHATTWQVVGFIDDDLRKRGHLVGGVPVLGGRESIPEAVKAKEVDEILIAMPSASRQTMRELFATAQKTGRPVRTLPALYELINGRVTVNQIREVQIEDLLGREPVETDIGAIAAYLSGRTVLVTGAGGSIGSELCRQIARYRPGRLILLGHGENSIFSIEQELRTTQPHLRLESAIADIRDGAKIDRLFAVWKPQVVFHAAAHKHVPLMEANPDEAVTNNVLGTRNLVEAADRTGAERFVMISTDKAVRPTSMMGCSKRVAEMIVQRANDHSRTRFVAVRFGNVLGSRGSVIPLFKKQIAAGGPVTVTHPEMRRYFMTIPEAVQLVIQAGALGEGGEIFLLNMGEPVRILDLARDLIRLSGLEPDVDIPIVFSGPRPGEKLFEELHAEGEEVLPTSHPKIVKLHAAPVDGTWLEEGLQQLERALASGDLEVLRNTLRHLGTEDKETVERGWWEDEAVTGAVAAHTAATTELSR